MELFVPKNLHHSVRARMTAHMGKHPARHACRGDIVRVKIPMATPIRMRLTRIEQEMVLYGTGVDERSLEHRMCLNMRSGQFHITHPDTAKRNDKVTSVLIESHST